MLVNFSQVTLEFKRAIHNGTFGEKCVISGPLNVRYDLHQRQKKAEQTFPITECTNRRRYRARFIATGFRSYFLRDNQLQLLMENKSLQISLGTTIAQQYASPTLATFLFIKKTPMAK